MASNFRIREQILLIYLAKGDNTMTTSDNNNFKDWTKEETVEDGKATFKDICKTIWNKVIYKDSVIRAVLLFITLCSINIMFVFDLGLGYWYFVEPLSPGFPSIVELAFYLVGFIFFTVYTIMCCRKKLQKQLLGITAALGTITLGSVITSGLFFPVSNAIGLAYSYITNAPDHEAGLGGKISYAINYILLIVYTILAFRSYSKNSDTETKTYRLSLVKITAIFSVVFAGFLVLYGFAFAKYEYEWFDEEYYTEYSQEYYLSEITTAQRKVYTDIKIGDNVSKTEKELTEKGFVKQKKNYEDFLWDCLFPYYIDDYLTTKNPENTVTNQYAIYCYTNGMEESDSWDDIISTIIISYDESGKINYKLFIPNADGCNIDGYYLDYEHGEQTRKWFDNIKNCENADNIMDFIRNTGAVIIEDEKYEGEIKVNTYKIILQCYYPLEVNFYDFLLNNDADLKNYFYDIEIITIDDEITHKQVSESW